ncbi:MAG: SUMF1/EgtB/PvdO family nonheme iron enzyme [Alsobacter sp.]
MSTPVIFISHSSRDREVAEHLCRALERRNQACWISSRDIGPGANYQEEIVRAIKRARAMVLVFSANANNSNEIKKELALAGQTGVPVIPVRVEDVVPSDAFSYELATRQWIDFFDDWDRALKRLSGTLDALTPAPRPLVQPGGDAGATPVEPRPPLRPSPRSNAPALIAAVLAILALAGGAYAFLGRGGGSAGDAKLAASGPVATPQPPSTAPVSAPSPVEAKAQQAVPPTVPAPGAMPRQTVAEAAPVAQKPPEASQAAALSGPASPGAASGSATPPKTPDAPRAVAEVKPEAPLAAKDTPAPPSGEPARTAAASIGLPPGRNEPAAPPASPTSAPNPPPADAVAGTQAPQQPSTPLSPASETPAAVAAAAAAAPVAVTPSTPAQVQPPPSAPPPQADRPVAKVAAEAPPPADKGMSDPAPAKPPVEAKAEAAEPPVLVTAGGSPQPPLPATPPSTPAPAASAPVASVPVATAPVATAPVAIAPAASAPADAAAPPVARPTGDVKVAALAPTVVPIDKSPPPPPGAPPADAPVAKSPPPVDAVGDGGQRFQDCSTCPEMVVVPKGTTMVGSPAQEASRQPTEWAPRDVAIAAPFAVSRYQVTFEEWDACVADGACNNWRPGDFGWGRGRRPVIFVSWNDAQAYVTWLSAKTGAHYRLLSEGEWEYAAKGCRTTRCAPGPFWFGASIKPELANYDARFSYAGSPKAQARRRTVPVDDGQANPFGLVHMVGNVRVWTQDCWNANAPPLPDGAARLSGDCNARVVRGGGWSDEPKDLRTAARSWQPIDERLPQLGIRIARDLTP